MGVSVAGPVSLGPSPDWLDARGREKSVAVSAAARANLPARVVVKRRTGKGAKPPPRDGDQANAKDGAHRAAHPDDEEDSDVDYSDEEEGQEDYKKGGYHPVKASGDDGQGISA